MVSGANTPSKMDHTACERAWNTMLENGIVSCIHFCLKSLLRFETWDMFWRHTYHRHWIKVYMMSFLTVHVFSKVIFLHGIRNRMFSTSNNNHLLILCVFKRSFKNIPWISKNAVKTSHSSPFANDISRLSSHRKGSALLQTLVNILYSRALAFFFNWTTLVLVENRNLAEFLKYFG